MIPQVNYTVTVEVTPEACKAYPEGNVSVDVQFVGFGKVTINIDLLCTCNCSADEVVDHVTSLINQQ